MNYERPAAGNSSKMTDILEFIIPMSVKVYNFVKKPYIVTALGQIVVLCLVNKTNCVKFSEDIKAHMASVMRKGTFGHMQRV